MNMKRASLNLTVFVCVFLGFSAARAWAVVELPDPTTIITVPKGKHFPDTPIPGTPIDFYWDPVNETIVTGPVEKIASSHDDFYAYSAELNTEMGYAGFDGSVGTGHLDLLIYTGPAGQNNDPVQGGFVFQDPLRSGAGSPSVFPETTTNPKIWGTENASPADVNPLNGPVLAVDVLKYLQTFDPNLTVPVFNFDMNQTGSNKDLFMAGEVYVWDPVLNTRIHTWAFDSNPNANGALDSLMENPTLADFGNWVPAIGDLNIGPYLNKKGELGGYYYEIDNNKGSGSLDFIGYAPDMDLSLYVDPTDPSDPRWRYWFVVDFRLAGMNDGFEELYLSGKYAPHGTPIVPEPASMILLGIGLAGVARLRKKAA